MAQAWRAKTALEVVDLRSLLPYDEQCALAGVGKCSKVIRLHEHTITAGTAGERAGVIAGKAFEDVGGPIIRVTTPDTLASISPRLEEHLLPSVEKVAKTAPQLENY